METPRKGEPILRTKFVGKKAPYLKTLSWPRAMFAMANVDQKKDPWKWLWMGYEGTRNQEHRSAFLLKIGQYHYVQTDAEHDKKAVIAFNTLLSEAAKNDTRRISARQYLAGIQQRTPVE